jgi:hypothetical protein
MNGPTSIEAEPTQEVAANQAPSRAITAEVSEQIRTCVEASVRGTLPRLTQCTHPPTASVPSSH